MQYQFLNQLFGQDSIALCCVNDQGKVSVISKCKSTDGNYIEVKTAQGDGYMKINVYTESGDTEEYYIC